MHESHRETGGATPADGSAPPGRASVGGLRHAVLARINRPLTFVERALEAVSMVALVALVLLTMGNAIGRHFFSAPVPGSLNMTLLYCMPAIVFLALPRTQAEGAHISATLVVDRLTPRVRMYVGAFVAAVILVVTAAMLMGVWGEAASSMGDSTNGDPSLPLGPSWVVVPLGLLVVVLRVVWQLAATRQAEPESLRSGPIEVERDASARTEA